MNAHVCEYKSGTLGDAVLRTGDMAVPVFSTTKDTVFDNKIEYRCQRCGVKKWAYGLGVGRVCLDCRDKGWGKDKYDHWYDMSEAADAEKSLSTILDYYYDSDDDSIEIGGEKFTNVIPKYRLNKVRGMNYHKVYWSYSCGCNAINMCLKMWGYDKQYKSSILDTDAVVNKKRNDYQDKYIYQKVLIGTECGLSWTEFYTKNIKPVFDFHDYACNKGTFKDAEMQWDFLDSTDFTNYSVIILGGDGVGHFTIVIGVNESKTHYLVTDQSQRVWLCDTSLMRKICIYGFSKSQGSVGLNIRNECSMYRVG